MELSRDAAFDRYARHLGLSHAQIVLISIIRSYSEEHSLPTPSLPQIAKSMKSDLRHIQYCLRDIEKSGFVIIKKRKRRDGGTLSNAYDFTPLLDRCEEIAAVLEDENGDKEREE